MDIYEFAVNYPKLYQQIDDEVEYYITTYQMNGSESLQDWDNYVENIYSKYEQQDSYDDANMLVEQQFDFRDRDRRRDFDRDRHRNRNRHRRDFDLRDLVRVIFLRRLFDRNRF